MPLTLIKYWPDKDPNSIEPYFIVWCDEAGLNDASANDRGELQGATIATATWTISPADETLVAESDNTLAVVIQGTSYPVNTVATIWLSGGTVGVVYTLTCRIITSDSRTLDKSGRLRIKNQ